MRSLLASLSLLLALTACTVSCAARVTPHDVPTMSDPAVAKLIIVEDGEEAGTCTVFKVGDNLAMTAGHCCADSEEDPILKLLGAETKKVARTFHAQGPHAVDGAEFTIAHVDEEHDVCTLKGPLKGPSLRLALHDPALGEHVWTAGYPKGIFLISSGHWSGRDTDGEGLASLSVWGGASGSPVMDPDGNVVGILRAYYPPMSTLSIVAPLEWVRVSLREARH